MSTDIVKIKEELQNCEEVTLPYEFEPNTWIKYITLKGEDEAFYRGGLYCSMGNGCIYIKNKSSTWPVKTCVKNDKGEVIYNSRFFIDTKYSTCSKDLQEHMKIVKTQQRIIDKLTLKLKELETCNQMVQIESNEYLSLVEECKDKLREYETREIKYKLILGKLGYNV